MLLKAKLNETNKNQLMEFLITKTKIETLITVLEAMHWLERWICFETVNNKVCALTSALLQVQ